MGLWADMNDFSDYNKRVPCPLCKGESEPTLVGGHFKCSLDSHLFNEDGSKIDVDCFCDACQPKQEPELAKALKKKVGKSKKKK
jgi:hypothetical protein